MLNIKRFVFNAFAENTYVVDRGGQECLIIDPGAHTPSEREQLLAALEGKKPVAIVLTHAHLDHIFAAKYLQDRLALEIFMHPLEKLVIEEDEKKADFSRLVGIDRSFRTTDMQGDRTLTLGEFTFDVLHTPGHSPGSVCLWFREDEVLFSGDTLFRGTIGRSDLPFGDYDKLIVSLMDGIMGLPGSTTVLPGHAERTTIADERTNNPFLQPFNEPEEEIADEDVQPIILSRR